MIRSLLLLPLLLLAGCATPEPAMVCPPPAPPLPAPPAPAPPKPVTLAPTAILVEQYKQLAPQAVDAVTRPRVTAGFVQAVLSADREARRWLLRLTAEGRHPQPATLAGTRAALGRLKDALAHAPEN